MGVQQWVGVLPLHQINWTCGFCGIAVAGNLGYYKGQMAPNGLGQQINPQQIVLTSGLPRIVICPHCERPTFFEGASQVPGVAFGAEVAHLPPDVSSLYKEARNCMAVSAFTASVLATRKLLMNVAVSVGAGKNESFQSYVKYLAENGYVPPNSKSWVDHIRQKANEATHEIPAIIETDAKDLLTFMEMILKLVFEFPNRVPKPASTVTP